MSEFIYRPCSAVHESVQIKKKTLMRNKFEGLITWKKNNCPKINSLLFVKIMVVKHKFLDFTYSL